MTNVPVAKIKSKILVESDFDFILDHVVNGGTLTELAKTQGFSFSEVMRLINSKKELKKSYDEAVEYRKEWAKERILQELKCLGMYNIQDAVYDDGSFKKIKDLPEDLARSVKEIDSDGGVKFESKSKPLQDAIKLLGLQTEKLDVTGKFSLADLITQAKSDKDEE